MPGRAIGLKVRIRGLGVQGSSDFRVSRREAEGPSFVFSVSISGSARTGVERVDAGGEEREAEAGGGVRGGRAGDRGKEQLRRRRRGLYSRAEPNITIQQQATPLKLQSGVSERERPSLGCSILCCSRSLGQRQMRAVVHGKAGRA